MRADGDHEWCLIFVNNWIDYKKDKSTSQIKVLMTIHLLQNFYGSVLQNSLF